MKLIKSGAILCSALLLIGCNEENPWHNSNGNGHISPIVVTDGTVKEMKTVTRAEELITTPSVEELRLDLKKLDGSFSKSWESVSEFSEEELFSVGAYTMEASYGSMENEGFESPYFYGSAEFEVEEGETSDVNITASLANTMVSIEYTDAFKTYFKSYSTQLHSKGGDYIVFTADETRPAYLRPGEVSLVVSLEKPNGVSGSFEPAVIKTKPRHHYHITLDINDGEVGEVELQINFDDTTVTDDVTIDLSDDLMLSEDPILTPEGFENGVAFDLFECQLPDSQKRYSITADGGLKSVTMTINSAQLRAKGVPAEVDLMSLTDAQQALFESLGFEIVGLWKNPDKMAWIDMTNVFKSIEGAGTHEFTVVVKDKLMKVTEPIKLVAKTKAVDLSFISAENSKLGINYADVKLNYNAPNFDKLVTFEALNSAGAWVKANIISVNNNGDEYSVRLAIPDGTYDVKVRAKYNGKERSNIVIVRQGVTLAVRDYNVWASKVILDVTAMPSSLDFNSIEIYVSTAGGEYLHHSNVSRDAANKQITLKGLAPGKKYSIKGTETGVYEATYPAVEVTTEVAQQVGNASFENWTTNNFTWTPMGGSLGGSPVTYKWYQPWTTDKWWDTTAKNSMKESTTGWTSYWCKSFPSTGVSYSAQEGSKSALVYVVNVGGTNTDGTAVGTDYVGEIFIGSADDNGAHSYDGHAFSSRPSGMKFHYMFSQKNDETCEVTYWIKAKDNTILVSGATTGLSATDSWKEFTIPFNYEVVNKKAATIYISFKSTTAADPSVSTKQTIEVAGANLKAHIGNKLWIDNIRLTY